MTEQVANSQDSAHYGWQHPPHAATTLSVDRVAIQAKPRNLCPDCGEAVQSGAESCPACGESLTRAPKSIRCMYCQTTASSELVVCPGCGRELRESPPRLLLLGVPALLALMLVALLVTQWERVSPIAWARTNLARGVVLVEDFSASIEPEMVIVMTPIVLDNTVRSKGVGIEGAPVIQPVYEVTATDAEAAQAASLVTPVPNADGGQSQESSLLAAATQPEPPVGIGGPATDAALDSGAAEDATVNVAGIAVAESAVAENAVAENAVAEVDAPEVGGMAASLATVAPTPVPTQTPRPTQPVAAANSENADNNTQSQVAPSPTSAAVGGVAQVAALGASEATPTVTPTATPTVDLTPLPTATATPVVYQVRAGDTLVTIAAQYEIDVDALMAANAISAQQVFAIQPGQMLIVPLPEPEIAVAAASDPGALRLTAPELVVPDDGATIGCATGGSLMWQRVQFVKDSDRYVLHLGFVSGETRTGEESVTWVLAQSSPVTQTEWELDRALCELAPSASGNQWRWWVEVVENSDGASVAVSPPSEIRGFIWQ